MVEIQDISLGLALPKFDEGEVIESKGVAVCIVFKSQMIFDTILADAVSEHQYVDGTTLAQVLSCCNLLIR